MIAREIERRAAPYSKGLKSVCFQFGVKRGSALSIVSIRENWMLRGERCCEHRRAFERARASNESPITLIAMRWKGSRDFPARSGMRFDIRSGYSQRVTVNNNVITPPAWVEDIDRHDYRCTFAARFTFVLAIREAGRQVTRWWLEKDFLTKDVYWKAWKNSPVFEFMG